MYTRAVLCVPYAERASFDILLYMTAPLTPPTDQPHPLLPYLYQRYASLHADVASAIQYSPKYPDFYLIFEHIVPRIPPSLLDAVASDLEQAFIGREWSRGIVLGFLYNPQLQLTEVIHPQRPTIYRNIIHSLRSLLEQRHVWERRCSVHDFFMILLRPDLVSVLSDDELLAILYALQNHIRDASFSDIIITIIKNIDNQEVISKIPLKITAVFGQLRLTPQDAGDILRMMSRYVEYTLLDDGLLVNALAAAVQIERNDFLLHQLSRLVRSPHRRERIYAALVEQSPFPEGCGYIYIRYQDLFIEKYPVDSAMRQKTYRICWKSLTWKQRFIVTFVPRWLVK